MLKLDFQVVNIYDKRRLVLSTDFVNTNTVEGYL